MPCSFFNAEFLKSCGPAEYNPEFIKKIYNQDLPVYFYLDSPDRIAQALREYRSSPDFLVIQQQYRILTDQLSLWCLENGIQVYFGDEELSIFSWIFNELFGEGDFFSLRAANFFSEAKAALEKILLLLNDEGIPLDSLIDPLKLT